MAALSFSRFLRRCGNSGLDSVVIDPGLVVVGGLSWAELGVDHDDKRPSLLKGASLDVRFAEKYVFCRADEGEWSWATPDRRREDERKPRIAEGR